MAMNAPLLQLNHLGKHFERNGTLLRALVEINLHGERGEVIGILGPNGAGKTTLLRLIATTLKPTSGAGRIGSADLVRDATTVRRQIGYVTGAFPLYPKLTGLEYLDYFGRLNGLIGSTLRNRIEKVVDQFAMGSFVNRRCADYSAGMKQKISIGRALLHQPLILLLDEATSNLDISATAELVKLVRACASQGMLVFYTTHRVAELERLCDKLLVVIEGRQRYFGSLKELSGDGDAGLAERYQNIYLGNTNVEQ